MTPATLPIALLIALSGAAAAQAQQPCVPQPPDAAVHAQLTVPHDLAFDRVREIVLAVCAHRPPEDRIFSIGYVPVKDGGAWSVESHGYRVTVSRGDVLRVYKDCTPSPCIWAVQKIGNWAF